MLLHLPEFFEELAKLGVRQTIFVGRAIILYSAINY